GTADDGRALPLDDPLATTVRGTLGKVGEKPEEIVDALLGIRAVFPAELADDEVVRGLLVEWLGDLSRHGVEATLRGAARWLPGSLSSGPTATGGGPAGASRRCPTRARCHWWPCATWQRSRRPRTPRSRPAPRCSATTGSCCAPSSRTWWWCARRRTPTWRSP